MRVGISGVGTIGRRHADTLERVDGISVVAAADPRAHDLDDELRSRVTLYSCLEAMLAEEKLDALVIASPSGLHEEQAILAARYGVHVLCEKPLAVTLPGADRIIDACARGGVELAVLHQFRFHPTMVALKRMLDESLGKLVFLDVALHWRRSPAYYLENGAWRGTYELDGGGALMNQGSHAVDLARWLGGPFASVSAHTTRILHQIEAEDTATATIEYARGGFGSVQVTTCASENAPVRVQVVGTEGVAQVRGDELTVNGERVEVVRPDMPSKSIAHEIQFGQIFTALARHGRPPVPGADARATLSAILAMYDSAARGGERVPCTPIRGVVAAGAA